MAAGMAVPGTPADSGQAGMLAAETAPQQNGATEQESGAESHGLGWLLSMSGLGATTPVPEAEEPAPEAVVEVDETTKPMGWFAPSPDDGDDESTAGDDESTANDGGATSDAIGGDGTVDAGAGDESDGTAAGEAEVVRSGTGAEASALESLIGAEAPALESSVDGEAISVTGPSDSQVGGPVAGRSLGAETEIGLVVDGDLGFRTLNLGELDVTEEVPGGLGREPLRDTAGGRDAALPVDDVEPARDGGRSAEPTRSGAEPGAGDDHDTSAPGSLAEHHHGGTTGPATDLVDDTAAEAAAAVSTMVVAEPAERTDSESETAVEVSTADAAGTAPTSDGAGTTGTDDGAGVAGTDDGVGATVQVSPAATGDDVDAPGRAGNEPVRGESGTAQGESTAQRDESETAAVQAAGMDADEATVAATGHGTPGDPAVGQSTTAETAQSTTAEAGQGTTTEAGQSTTAEAGQSTTAEAGQGTTAGNSAEQGPAGENHAKQEAPGADAGIAAGEEAGNAAGEDAGNAARAEEPRALGRKPGAVRTREAKPAIRQRRDQQAPADRRRADPEQILAAHVWMFDPQTLRERVEEPDRLWDVADRLTDRLEFAERDNVRAGLLSLRAVIYRVLGEDDDALTDAREGLRHAEASGEARPISIAQARLAHVLQWRGEFDEADRLYARADSEELSGRLRAEIRELAGRSSFEQGRYLEAVNHFERALDLSKGADEELVERVELALDLISDLSLDGWGPYARTREEILGETLTPIPLRDDGTGLWGYAAAVEPQYAQAQAFSEGVAWVRRPDSPAWELIDQNGAVLIGADSGYLAADRFSEGLAWVTRDQEGGWFAIDRGNRMVVPGGWQDARPFRNGLALFQRGGWGAIDKQGRIAVQPQFRQFATALSVGGPIDGFTGEGLAVVDGGNGRFGVIDRTGQQLVPPVHRSVVIHPSAFLITDEAGRWGALDRDGRPLVETRYVERADAIEQLQTLRPDVRPVI
ncbi:WG repeat-containing protein [Actinoplanes sp. NPDC051851]|uniref:WG repeat-containing protein n=1 Tax=Actinoplanes sp. NPDC051851 TaxID=3154753 RepID=UPI0034291BB2